MSTADAPRPKAPVLDGPRPHLLVVRAPYYTAIVDGLRDGAERLLREAGATFDVLDVAGALELAAAIRLAQDLGPGHTIVTVLADYDTRYQSKLFNPEFLRAKKLPVPRWLERSSGIKPPFVKP